MENTERQKFEESWKEAFDGSEMSPSDSVWTNIDLKLDNNAMKRRVVFYQRLAAASVLFAVVLAGVGTQYFRDDHTDAIVLKQNENKDKPAVVNKAKDSQSIENNQTDDRSKNLSDADQNSNNKSDHVAGSVKEGVDHSTIAESGNNKYSILKDRANPNSESKQRDESDRQLQTTLFSFNKEVTEVAGENFNSIENKTTLDKNQGNIFTYSTAFLSPQLSQSEPDRKIESVEERIKLFNSFADQKVSEKKTAEDENMWLSFGGAAGSYNPGGNTSSLTNSQALASPAFSSVALVNQSTRPSTGSAYSLGLNVGKKVSERWVVQAGVNYLNRAIDETSYLATTTSANRMEAIVADYYAADKSASVTITQPYTVSNSMEFVSVPMQAGYLLIDRKFGLLLNAGVATDVFLRNTLKDQSGRSDKFTQGSGSDSPYRSLTMSGLTSTELSYKMGRQYRISLVPGFRYYFQPSLKSQSSAVNNPLILDIGFRFRYIFE